jgi:hypothetical protein
MLHNHARKPLLAVLILFMMACAIPGLSGPAAPGGGIDSTKVALGVQSTGVADQLTQSALQAVSVPPTDIPFTATPEPTQTPAPTPTMDISARIRSSKILVYEDGATRFKPWIRETLDLMGLEYMHIGDAIGDFMGQLNAKTWDLIIIGAEAKNVVQGEFWDVIFPQIMDDKTALILEVKYLDTKARGRIASLLHECGVEFQQDYPSAQSIYFHKPEHPIFSDPNTNFSLINYSKYWKKRSGDLLRLGSSGDAEMLAGVYPKQKYDYGVLTTCIEGRVVIQTFSNHDYHEEDIKALWENYITYVLTNHYRVLP